MGKSIKPLSKKKLLFLRAQGANPLLKRKATGTAPCFYCGKLLTCNNLTIDHFIPKSKGGTNEIQNLRLACKRCNSDKGNKDYGREI
jgi:5-methylcytosine-specific restriction endonuclease McrA